MNENSIKKSIHSATILRYIVMIMSLLLALWAIIFLIQQSISGYPKRMDGQAIVTIIVLIMITVLLLIPTIIISIRRYKITKNITARGFVKFYTVLLALYVLPIVGLAITSIIIDLGIPKYIMPILASIWVLTLVLFAIFLSKTKKMKIFYKAVKKKQQEIIASNNSNLEKNELILKLQELYNNYDFEGISNFRVLSNVQTVNDKEDIQTNDDQEILKAKESRYDASYISSFFHSLGRILLFTFTLGILYPFTKCMKISFETKHTKYDGRQLYFDGNGAQLIGKWIIWMLLSTITLGIYTIFIPNKITKWVTKHTHIKGEESAESYYNGLTLARLGLGILGFFASVCTIFILYPFVKCLKLKYKSRHTFYDGHRLVFTANGAMLFGKWILWLLLCIPTCGIFILFIPGRFKRWVIKNTHYDITKHEISEETETNEVKSEVNEIKLIKFKYGNSKNILGYANLCFRLVLPLLLFLFINLYVDSYFLNVDNIDKLNKIYTYTYDQYELLTNELNANVIDENTLSIENGNNTSIFIFDKNHDLVSISLNIGSTAMENKDSKTINILSPINEFDNEGILYEIFYKDGSYLLSTCTTYEKSIAENGYNIQFNDIYNVSHTKKVDSTYGELVQTYNYNNVTAYFYRSPIYFSDYNPVLVIEGSGEFNGDIIDNISSNCHILVKEGITKISNLPNAKSISLPTTLTALGSESINFLICDTIDLSNIKDIDEYAFNNCQFKTISLVNKITKINKNIFYDTSIEELTIGNNVLQMEASSFTTLSGLKRLTIPFIGTNAYDTIKIEDFLPRAKSIAEINITNTKKLAANTFSHLDKLTTIVLNEGIEEIESNAFENIKLERLVIPSGPTLLNKYTFSYARIDNLEIAGSITTLDSSVFYRANINNLIFLDGLNYLKYNTFSYATITNLTLPDSILTIEQNSFNNAIIVNLSIPFVGYDINTPNTLPYLGLNRNHLQTINLTNSIEIADDFVGDSYMNRFNLSSVTLNEGLKTIGRYAFQDCSFTEIIIPNSIENLYSDAFFYCEQLANVYYNATLEQWCNINITGNTYIMNYAQNFYLKNANNEYEALVELKIPESITSVDSYQFYGFKQLTKISLPQTLQNIGNYAFANCKLITTITIPKSVTKIGDGCFSGCNNLNSVYYDATFNDWLKISFSGDACLMENADTFMLKDATNQYQELTTIEIPLDVTYIGDYQFSGFYQITDIVLHDNITEIGDYAFSGCSGVDNINIPQSVTKIGDGAFKNTNITSLNILPNVTSIGFGAFENCNLLENITLPFIGDGNTNTNFDYIFGYSSIPQTLKNVTITGGNLIDENAFEYCRNIENITLPNSINSIGHRAFYNCSSLKEIVIPQAVLSIGYEAFEGCESLVKITLPFVGDGKTNTNFGYIFGASSYSYHRTYIPSSLTTVVITGGDEIDDYAFYRCDNITNITLADSIIRLGYNAFRYCTSLSTITIPKNVVSIEQFAFDDNLTSFTFNANRETWDLVDNQCSQLDTLIKQNKVTFTN